MSRKRKDRESERPQRLSLAELAAHDDVCSDVLIDNVSPPLKTYRPVCSHAHILLGLLQVAHTEESDKTHSNPRYQGR